MLSDFVDSEVVTEMHVMTVFDMSAVPEVESDVTVVVGAETVKWLDLSGKTH